MGQVLPNNEMLRDKKTSPNKDGNFQSLWINIYIRVHLKNKKRTFVPQKAWVIVKGSTSTKPHLLLWEFIIWTNRCESFSLQGQKNPKKKPQQPQPRIEFCPLKRNASQFFSLNKPSYAGCCWMLQEQAIPNNMSESKTILGRKRQFCCIFTQEVLRKR